MKIKLLPIVLLTVLPVLNSCSDFLTEDSDHVIYADNDHLNNATDTIYSVTGIQNKLQAIADRTILLGEVRGDLVDVTSNATADLRNLSDFNIDDNNTYNAPKDYYAIINNCNYFIAKADTALKNNRNEYIFMKEYAAVKAYRAWTYLQLVLNYGSVPFVTEPILTKKEANEEYPRADIQAICQYFIKDLAPLVSEEYPQYGTIRSTDSRFFYFPVYVLLGDLNLWSGNYKEAALDYYRYLNTRNGTNSYYATGINKVTWNHYSGEQWDYSNSWTSINDSWSYYTGSEYYSDQGELITMIPGDSISSEGNYSQLRNLFNSRDENNDNVSLIPSTGIEELSASQANCIISGRSGDLDTLYAPANLESNLSGDLRLYAVWNYSNNAVINGKKTYLQSISKYNSRNIHIYRRQLIYLRMAEALNRAGYPRFAYRILAGGVNNNVIESDIKPYYPKDSQYLDQFDFSSTKYILASTIEASNENTEGIHDRGCGFSLYNKYYQMPVTTAEDSLAYQEEKVEDMIADEEGLEFAFEGDRFYDLMRIALRRNDPAFLADRIYKREGTANIALMKGKIKVDLYNTKNWYMSWKGKIGYTN